ncbi:MAG: hypothetical protein JNL73_07620 [Anaerolineales bacterium]|nr:hypothetical protein [Anaerolineales bacterium]
MTTPHPTRPDQPVVSSRFLVGRAWLVHLYTALGNIAAFSALIAITNRHPGDVFIWLAIAIFIDSTDGALARAWDVARWTPNFDGRKLDDITDYLTYVFIPMYFAHAYGLVAGPGVLALGVVLLAAAFGFCQDWAKTEDGYFTGFPNYWNIVVLYLYWFNLPLELNAFILVALAFLVFVPIKYVYATKTVFWRPVTLALGVVWGLLLLALLRDFEQPDRLLLALSFLYPVYYTALSFYLHFRPQRRNP